MISRACRILLLVCLLVSSTSAEIHYVSKTGSDGNSGQRWEEAWASIGKVNTSVSGGDTVLFGTGIWMDATLIPVSGSYDAHTVYACSTFAEADPTTGDYNLSQIWGITDSLMGWTRIGSSNIYSRPLPPEGDAVKSVLFQGEEPLWREVSAYQVDTEGEWWCNSDSMILYAYDRGAGYDPDDYAILRSNKKGCVEIAQGQHHVTVWGLRLKYAAGKVLTLGAGQSSDSIFVEHCHLSHAFGRGGNNPSLIYSDTDPDPGEWNRIVACSLGNVWAFFQTSTAGDANYAEEHAHGNAITWYSQAHNLIDSCTVYGYFSFVGIYYKNDNPYDNQDIIIRHNTFDTRKTALLLYNRLNDVNVYGNVFIENSSAVQAYYSRGDTSGDYSITNNTMYNCGGAVIHIDYEGSYPINDVGFRYNVIYNDDGGGGVNFDHTDASNPTNIACDSNLYFAGGLELSTGRYGAKVTYSLSQWRALGWDLRSFTTKPPLFQASDLGYFARLDTLEEMNRFYGGQLWRKYGAIQDVVDDTERPDRVGDLTAEGYGPGELYFAWTAPANERVVGYEIWYGTDAFGEAELAGLPSVVLPLREIPPGRTDSYVLSGLQDGQLYHVALKAVDISDNVSLLSNQATAVAESGLGTENDGDRPLLLSPGSRADVTTLTPVLTVRNLDSEGSDSYRFEVAEESSFSELVTYSSMVMQQAGDVTTWEVDTVLIPGMRYYWRVLANGINYSATWYFTVKPKVHPEPNPFDLRLVDRVTFTGIPQGSTFMVRTILGEVVREWADLPGGDLIWDGTNASGNLISSGIYLWYVVGTDVRGKLVVKR